MKIRKRNMVVFLLCVIMLFVLALTIINNSRLTVTKITVTHSNIPESFSGFKIAQISDLHNTDLGDNHKKITGELEESHCDIIVFTGDIIDSRDTDIDTALSLVEKCVKIAPCYYVTGNHEARVKAEYEIFKSGLEKMGVTVLENGFVDIYRNDESISLIGLHDTGFDLMTGIDYILKDTLPENDNYKILLAHRPEYFDKYEGVNLIFSGHAHGGQIRLPFIGGLFAPGQGAFPKYDEGKYEQEGRCMIVSRGIGNSLFPLRVNNNPELIVVTLQKG